MSHRNYFLTVSIERGSRDGDQRIGCDLPVGFGLCQPTFRSITLTRILNKTQLVKLLNL